MMLDVRMTGIGALLLASVSLAGAQVESRSSFTTAGADASGGPYRAHTTMGTSAGGRHAGGSLYEAHAGWKASIHNSPVVAGGQASLGVSSNGTYSISYTQLQQATGARDPDGDPISFLVSAVGGGLKVDGADVASVELGEGKSFTWTPASGGRLSVVAFDGVLASSEVGFTTGITAPAFTQQPVDTRVEKGMPALLSPSVFGTGPLTFQWFKNGQQVSNATNQTFSVFSATRGIQGRYELEVVGPGGTNRSQSAYLQVVSAQRIHQLAIDGDGHAVLRFGDADGEDLSGAELANFTIQTSTNLVDWSTVSTNGAGMTLVGGNLSFRDVSSPTETFRFYRVLE